MKKRSQIEEKYKWDLSSYISSDEEIEKIFKIMEKMPEKYAKYDGNLNKREYLIEYLTKFKKEEILIGKLASYIGNSLNVDSSDVKMQKYSIKFGNLIQKISEAKAFIKPQLYNLDDEYLKSFLTDKKLKHLNNCFLDILRGKPHKVDQQTEELISKMGKFLGPESGLHSDLVDEIKFEDITDEKGKKIKIDGANISKYLQGKNRALRKAAFESRMKAYKQFNQTFADNYLNSIEGTTFFTKLYKYNSVLESELFGDQIPQTVFDNNLKIVKANLNLMHEYYKAQKKESGLKDYSYYDTLEDKTISKKIQIEDAQQIVLKALAPLGEEYLSRVKQKFADRSIDYLPNEHKNPGGYCSNTYDAKTVILMNFTNDYDSLTTLIHEMGHCINAEYFNEFQPYEKAEIIIFAAEIASTVNEILLNLYMQQNAKTKRERKLLIGQLLETFIGTVFRQTLFTEFELFAHERIAAEEPTTYADLNKKYLDLTKEYFGSAVKIPALQAYEWARVPHFYSPFYVYTYSTGMITAITIASRLIKDANFKDDYIKFLKNGTNLPAVEMLKEIGIDLTTEKPFIEAFNFIKNELKEYICQ